MLCSTERLPGQESESEQTGTKYQIKKVREVILQQVCATANWTILSCLWQQFHNIYYCLSNYRSCPSDIPYTCIANVNITVGCRCNIANSKHNCEALSLVGWTRSHLYRWEQYKSTHKDSPGSRTSGTYVWQVHAYAVGHIQCVISVTALRTSRRCPKGILCNFIVHSCHNRELSKCSV